MKIPVFEEIIISNFEDEHLFAKFENSRIGQVPSYINLSGLNKADINTYLPLLENVFTKLNLHTKFPYPTYIICQSDIESIFPRVSSIKDLPEHFFKRVKRPNNKELQLLNKLGLKVEKLTNLDKEKIQNQFIDTSFPQRKLYELSKELYFWETLHHHLIEKVEKQENSKGKYRK